MKLTHHTLKSTFYALTTAILCSASSLAEEAPKPIKIFILSGQSNMTGRGTLELMNGPEINKKSTLLHYVQQPENLKSLSFLRNGANKTESGWTIRGDVFITMGEWPHLQPGEKDYSLENKHGGLGPYYGGRKARGFGPELAIGHLLGEHFEEPVLLVKVSFGGNNLAVNFRPPSSGGTLGDKYPKIISAYQDAVKNLPEIIPSYTPEQGYELAGFFWNQGLSDGGKEKAAEYEENMANLIKDLRRDLNGPKMPVAMAVTGNWGWDRKDMLANFARHRVKHPNFTLEKGQERVDGLIMLQKAQLAVPKRPEFKGNVAIAETRDFWRSRPIHGGIGTEEHWNANGESYWLIGEAMAKQMLNLQNLKQ